MTPEEIKAAREATAKAGHDVQVILVDMKAAKAAGKSVSEFEEKFQKAFPVFVEAKKASDLLESASGFEADYERFMKPAAESTLRRMGIDSKAPEFKKLHGEVFSVYIKGGLEAAREHLVNAKAPREMFSLLGTQDDLGGLTVPEDFRAEVIKDAAGFASFRAAGARSVPTSRSELVFPTIKRNAQSAPKPNMYTSGFAGKFRKEGAQGTDGSAPAQQNQPTWGELRIPVHTWQPDAVVLPAEFMEDTAVPIDQILAELIAEVKGLDEDYEFTLGDGVVRPRGLLFNPGDSADASSVPYIPGTDASLLKYSGIVDTYTGVPAQYRQDPSFKWMCNSSTYGKILKLESTGGFLLFPPNALPGTLMTKPVVFNEWMDSVAANTFPLVAGAFRQYIIAERAELRIQRLVERFAPNVAVLPTARVGGQIARTNAFRVLKVATS